MPKLSRELLTSILVFFLFVSGVASSKDWEHLTPIGAIRLSAFVLGVAGYAVFWFLVHKRSREFHDILESSTATTEIKKVESIRFYSFLGKAYMASGGVALLLGTQPSKYQVPLVAVGCVVLCVAAYLLFAAEKISESKIQS